MLFWCICVHNKWCLDKTIGQIENGLERGFVKHWLNYVNNWPMRFKKFPDSCGRDLRWIHVRIVVAFARWIFLSLKEIPSSKYNYNYSLMLQINPPLLGGLYCNMENGCCR